MNSRLRSGLIIALTVFLVPSIGCTLLKLSITEEMRPLREQVITRDGSEKILLMELNGVISSGDSSSLSRRPGMLSTIREQLDKARKDPAIKAIVLRVNSPGGGVTASDVLYHELRRFKQDTGAIVIAHIMDVGASGGYYAALAADRITAQPTAITGSIGVIMFRLDATGLMQKIGLQTTEIVSGNRKGMGSPFHVMTDEERALFQNMIDSLQLRFVDIVVEGRKLSRESVLRLADGRVYTSQEALTAGLIDGIGYLDDAVLQAAQLAKIPHASLVAYLRPEEYRPNIYSFSLFPFDAAAFIEPGAYFQYLWQP